MYSYSVKLVVNQQRIKTNALCSLYLRVIINRVKIQLHLGISWPYQFIDVKNGRILPRNRSDKDFRDYEMIISTEIGKVNEIFKIYRLQDKLLSPEQFRKELQYFSRRKDLIAYMRQELDDRFKDKQIVKRTWKNHNTTINRLEEFKSSVPFFSVDSKFLNKFCKWLESEHNNDTLTVWSRIKDIKYYLHKAREEGIGVNADFEKFTYSTGVARPVFIEDSEIKTLIQLLKSGTLTGTQTKTLRAFLFSCFTSLRISDVFRANWGWVNMKNEMIFLPWKTRKFGRLLTVPLSETAIRFIDKKKGHFFELPTEQEMNRSLKEIAAKAGIKVHLTFHVSRHTFATHFYRNTKDILTLSKILGHSKIQTTMIYAHINDEDKLTGMQKFEKMMLEML
jgi:integrase